MSTRRAIALFAKNPVAAAVKTRLVPPLTQAEASALASAFLADSSANLVDAAASLAAKPCIFYDPPSLLETPFARSYRPRSLCTRR